MYQRERQSSRECLQVIFYVEIQRTGGNFRHQTKAILSQCSAPEETNDFTKHSREEGLWNLREMRQDE